MIRHRQGRFFAGKAARDLLDNAEIGSIYVQSGKMLSDEIFWVKTKDGWIKQEKDMPMLTNEKGNEYRKICDEKYPYRDEARMWLHAEKYAESLKEGSYEDYWGVRMIMEMIRWSHLHPERMKGFFESPKDLYKVEWSNFHEEFLKNIKDAPPALERR